MNNTNYTIELLIAGISTALWMVLLTMAFWGNWLIEWLPGIGNELAIVLVLFPFVYMIGVLIDRVSSGLFGPMEDKLQKNYFPDRDAYKMARSITYTRHEALIKLFEYNIVRIRICRNWCLNGVLILFAWIILLFSVHSPVLPEHRLGVFFFSLLFLASSIVASYLGLKKLIRKDLDYLKIQSEI
ncbi:MAG: hypothetical protein IPL49_02125 [Saprospirales bacterium]|nr:hypothetical protein [Saprospirales bacterium]MBK8489714.1 hypothetical protein [Saprospirales bacterium]